MKYEAFGCINGPNLNLLGLREPDVYGSRDLCRAGATSCGRHAGRAAAWNACGDAVQCTRARLVDRDSAGALRAAVDGVVINPAAYTHTSVALC